MASIAGTSVCATGGAWLRGWWWWAEKASTRLWSNRDSRSSPDGSEICIPHRVELELRPLLGASAVEYLAVRAIETKVDPDRVVGVGDAGESEYSRIRESFEIAVLDWLPGSHERGHGGKSAFQPAWQWIRRWLSGRRSSGRSSEHRPANAPGATPNDDWVVLAKLVRTRVARRGEHVRFATGARRHLR